MKLILISNALIVLLYTFVVPIYIDKMHFSNGALFALTIGSIAIFTALLATSVMVAFDHLDK